MEHIKTNDTVCFTANFYHPVSGFSYAADATPRWLVYKDVATTAMSGNTMTARTDVYGSYVGSFVATLANGFVANSFYDVQVSGMVAGVAGITSVKQFVLDDIYYSNITQVSGIYVSIGDFGGSSSAPTAVAIRQEIDANSLMLTSISGDVTGLDGAAMRGTDNAALATNLMAVSGIVNTTSANILNIDSDIVALSGSILLADISKVSGSTTAADNMEIVYSTDFTTNYSTTTDKWQVEADVLEIDGDPVSQSGIVDANVVQVSGIYVDISDFGSSTITIQDIYNQASGALVAYDVATYTDILTIDSDIYFAHIKYISDTTNNSDEFAVQWFKNDQPVASGDLTVPAISVYNTSTGAAIFEHKGMNYASSRLGVVRYNSTPMTLASGEPYLVETSGTIDATNRIWKTIVGIDLL